MLVRTRRLSRTGAGDRRRTERGEEDVVLAWAPQGDADPLRELADDDALPLELGSERLVAADEDEVPVSRAAVVTGGSQSFLDTAPLHQRPLDLESWLAERRSTEARRRRTDARRRPPQLELGGHVWCGDGPADAERGEPERLRQRPQHDQVRQLGEQRHAGDARVLEVRLVDDDDRVGVGPRERRDLGRVAQVTRGVVRIADPDQRGALGVGSDARALELGDDPVQGIGGRLDRGDAAGSEVRSGAEADQLVRSGADHDLIRPDAAVGRRRSLQLRVGAVRVLVQAGEALGERNLRHGREGRRVLVEAQDLFEAEPVTLGDLGRRRRPGVRPKSLGQCDRAHASSSAAAWRSSPSSCASVRPISRARASPDGPALTI